MKTPGIAAKGRGDLLAHREGRKMTRAQAIRAKCYDCMGGYVDGKRDCEIPRCPLYGFMPYRKTRLNPPEPPKTTPVINFVDLESGEGGLDLPTSQITEKKQLKMEGI